MDSSPDHDEVSFEERLDAGEILAERILTGVRASWGVDLPLSPAETPVDRQVALNAELEVLHDEGWIWRSGSRFGPTELGFNFADGIARRLVEALDSSASGSLG